MTKSRYVLTLQADGQRDDAEQIRKLRALLKLLGRIYGLRCVRVEAAASSDEAEPLDSMLYADNYDGT